jgi:chaperone modulatory protein CbpM
MPSFDAKFLPAEIVEETTVLGIEDLRQMFAVDERRIVEWVEEGVLTVAEMNTAEWRFNGAALRRVRIALRLERDLGINLAGIALALDLLEELEQLRRLRRV